MSLNKVSKNPSISEFSSIRRFWNKEFEIVCAKILPGEYYVTEAGKPVRFMPDFKPSLQEPGDKGFPESIKPKETT